jgi:hypothetical protein
VAEIFLGGSILRKKYHFVPPFFKSIHRLVWTTFQNVQQFKAALCKIKYACPAADPSRIVDEYLDPWWIEPSLDTNHLEVTDGLPKFIEQVCQLITQ